MRFKPLGCRKWTNAEDEVLIAHFGSMPYNEIGKSLLRTPKAIECRVTKLIQRGRLDASKRFMPTQPEAADRTDTMNVNRDALCAQLAMNIFYCLVEWNHGRDTVKDLYELAKRIATKSLNETWK